MNIIGEFASIFTDAADEASAQMDVLLTQRPVEPDLNAIWGLEYSRLGHTAQNMCQYAALLTNLDAQAVLAQVKPQLDAVKDATAAAQQAIAGIKRMDALIDLLGKFDAGRGCRGVRRCADHGDHGDRGDRLALPAKVEGFVNAINAYKKAEQSAAEAVEEGCELAADGDGAAPGRPEAY